MRVLHTVEFDMAHREHDAVGRDRQLHGHRWMVKVAIVGDVGRDGRVVDHGAVDLILDAFVGRFDHRTMLFHLDPLFLYLADPDALDACNLDRDIDLDAKSMGIDGMMFDPTVENVTQYFANILADQDIGVHEVIVSDGIMHATTVPQSKCPECGRRGAHKSGCVNR